MDWETVMAGATDMGTTGTGTTGMGGDRAALQALESYWRELRGARRLPVRTEVEPARIDAILHNCFILEHVAPGIARIRVAGQALAAITGHDLRGMPISALFDVGSRLALQGWLGQVFQGPALVELPLRQSGGFMRPGRTGRMLILPLLGAEGAVTRAIGAVVADGPLAARPVAIDAAEPVRCEQIGQVAATPLTVVTGGLRTAKPARGGLRLVVSNG
jgi:hypothetical protein